MQHGEFWYAMEDAGGDPHGYARLRVDKAADGAITSRWELHLAFVGGTYEEERSAVHDPQGRLLEGTYAAGDERVDLERQGRHLRGRRRRGAEETTIDVEVSDDAQTGMAFVLAADQPFEQGSTRSFGDYNEAQGLQAEGQATLTMAGPETLERGETTIDVWRVVLRRADGRELPIWIDGERRIVRVDWGGGNFMVLSDVPTRHLFQPQPWPVDEIPSEDASRLVVAGTLKGVSPEGLFAWWTDAQRLVRWWPQEAEVGEGEGASFHMVWKEPAFFLRGSVRAWDPGRRLVFTWVWDHLPDAPAREVEVLLAPTAEGTRLVITHGPYGDGEAEGRERDGHLQGWRSCCARLAAAVLEEPPG